MLRLISSPDDIRTACGGVCVCVYVRVYVCGLCVYVCEVCVCVCGVCGVSVCVCVVCVRVVWVFVWVCE